MLNDLTPIVVDLPKGQDVKIYPLGDIHYGSLEFNKDRWEMFLDKVRNEENSYFVLIGDLIDNGVQSAKIKGLSYGQTCRPSEQKRYIANCLTPIKDRILAIVPGNHEGRNADDDDDPIYDICAKLDIEDRYRANGAFVILRVGNDSRSNSIYRPTYTIFCGHGCGGGMYIGSGANRIERFSAVIDGVDLYITGHTHKPFQMPMAKLKVDPHNKQIIVKNNYAVTVSSWLNYGGYGFQKMLGATAQVSQEILLSGKGKNIQLTMS